ncbi:hypothetical protein Bbelb_116910 [Branchiostoma belcheri]|nr:hypothetical protein Bbelb_116910 [Branchiostoma belcheri]
MFAIIHNINTSLALCYKRSLYLVDTEEEFGLQSLDATEKNEESSETPGDESKPIVDCKLEVWKLLKNSVVSVDPNLACNNGMDLLHHTFYEKDENESQLDENLAALGMVRVPSEADGSCLFMSVSFQLMQLLSDGHIGTKICSHLSKLFPDLFPDGQPICDIDQETLAIRLRAAMVDEWLNNEDVYKEFVPDVNFQTEALQYLRRDVFDGDMGDMMVLALANVLNIAIILVTPQQAIPLVPVFPPDVLDKQACMYLAFDKDRMHFDSTTESTLNNMPEPDTDSVVTDSGTTLRPMSSCSCGVNDKTPRKRCHSSETVDIKYKSRCPCSRQGQPCGVSCRCKGCTNSYGQRISSPMQGVTVKRAKRSRSQEWMASKPSHSNDYMQKKGHGLNTFSKKDDIHLVQSKSPESSIYLRKRFTEEQIKRRQKTLATRNKYAKHAVRLNKKAHPRRPRDSQKIESINNDKSWEAGIYNAEQVIDQRLKNGGKEYLVKWSGTHVCTWEPAKNIYDPRLITAFELSRGAGSLNKPLTKKRKNNTLG